MGHDCYKYWYWNCFLKKFDHVTSNNCNHMLFIILSMCRLHFQNVCMCIFMFTCAHTHTHARVHKCHLHLCKFTFKTSWKRCQQFNHEATQALFSTKDFKMFIEKLARNSNFDMHFLIKIYSNETNNLWIWSLLKNLFRKIIIIYKYSH
jgi:hypothetical protein